jgi:teichuronic acid biosynthesis glycosyltransferase TuaH
MQDRERSAVQEVVVWLSGQSWDQDGGTHRAMATAVSAHARILWVDPPDSPLARGGKPAVKPVLTEVTDKIARLTPVVLPGFIRPGLRLSTPVLMRGQIRWALRELRFRPAVVVMLYLGGLLGGWGEDVVNVMYGTDDYVAGAELMRVSPRLLQLRERQALSRADAVVAVTPELGRRWAGMGAKPVVIPNGCWPLRAADGPPAKRVCLPSPVVGVIGRLSGRIDIGLLEAIAESGLSLVLMGPCDPRWEPARLHSLIGKPSVRYLGPVHYSEVPAQLAAIDVGITPYADSDFNRASFPLKTLEYLSLGIPAVATGLPAMRWLRADLEEVLPAGVADQVLLLADDGEGFVQAIKTLSAAGTAAADQRIAFAERHSWASRAARFAAEIGLPGKINPAAARRTSGRAGANPA